MADTTQNVIPIEQDLADNYAAIREQRDVSWEQLADETEPNDLALAGWMRSDFAAEAEARRGRTLQQAKKAEAARKRREAKERQDQIDSRAAAAAEAVLDSGLTTPKVAGNAVDGEPTKDAGTGEQGRTDEQILADPSTDPTAPASTPDGRTPDDPSQLTT